MDKATDAIFLQNISKSFNKNVIFQDLSCQFSSKYKNVIVGDNGSGKTTLLKLILGFLKPDLGLVNCLHKEIGYVPHRISLIRDIYVSEVKEYFCNFEEKQYRSFNKYLIEVLNLKPLYLKKVKDLSFGEAKRVQLFTSFFNSPSFVLLDEPMNGLALKQKGIIKNYLGEISKDVGLIFTSHDFDFIQNFCENVFLIKDKRLEKIKKDQILQVL